MNQSSRSHAPLKSTTRRAPQSIAKVLALTLGVSALGVLSACSDVTALTKERVMQSETAVQNAQGTIGKSEDGAVELQQARDKLDAAKSALAKHQDTEAQRAAVQAQLLAELAVTKAQSAEARRAANEVLASVETLRQETKRDTATTR